jgi:hypothetical protein
VEPYPSERELVAVAPRHRNPEPALVVSSIPARADHSRVDTTRQSTSPAVGESTGTDVLLPANESHAFAPRTGARGHSLAKPRQVARPACAEWWWTARLYDARQMPARRSNKGGRANAQETGR